MGEKSKKLFVSAALVVIGNFICSLGVTLFLQPSGLATGSTTGIALTLEHYLDIPISYFIFVFNMCMLVLGLIVLGKKFVVSTVASSFLYPAFLELQARVIGERVISTDSVICACFASIFIGVGLGILIRAGASTGGMDIVHLIVRKLLHVPVSASMYAFDVLILSVQLLYRPVESVLYGILMVFIYTMVLDKMLMLGTTRTEVKIISDKTKEICSMILTDVDRGVTLLNGESGYLHEEKQIVLSVISNRELPKLEKLVHDIDPECFMIVNRISEVKGRGFSMSRK